MQKQPIQEVKKPILHGSWHGKDAYKLARKLFLSVLVVSLIYLLLSLMLNFNELVWRIVVGVVVVAMSAIYLYYNGIAAGQGDAAYGEIMYQREKDGKAISPEDRARCYHPGKGWFAVLVGTAPFVLVAIVFAFMTKPVEYSLGVLPNWLNSFTRQSEFGNALQYYSIHEGMSVLSAFRLVVRAMTMPFINVAVALGDTATLWCERLSPIWILIAPMGYALGYRQGMRVRTRINTGIVIGMSDKKRKQRREHGRRMKRSDEPEQLI